MNLKHEIMESFEYIKSKTKYTPTIGIVLGTGFASFADLIEDAEYYKYENIPNFPIPTVDGHKGSLIIGRFNGKEIVVMNGRCHYYEGYSARKITLPIRVMKLLGVETLITTNCGGQANENITAGDLFVISNHLNFSGCNPLIGENLSEFGERFPDLAYPYNKELRNLAKNIASKLNINLKEGVYAMFSGPSYETATETIMAAKLGADIVGMSTVPEVIVANHCNMKVLAFSGIPCLAAAYSDSEITHQQVIENCKNISGNGQKIISEFIKLL